MNKIKTLIRAKPKHGKFLVSKILPRKKKAKQTWKKKLVQGEAYSGRKMNSKF